jgi:hypothetical protein
MLSGVAARGPFMSTRPTAVSRGLVMAVGFALLVAAGCALSGGTIGGREKCWPEGDQRAASLWRGILRIDSTGGRLETPEGDVIPLLPGTLTTRVGQSGIGELVRGTDIIAIAGTDVTLFGGAGSDGALVVCAVEEIHGDS